MGTVLEAARTMRVDPERVNVVRESVWCWRRMDYVDRLWLEVQGITSAQVSGLSSLKVFLNKGFSADGSKDFDDLLRRQTKERNPMEGRAVGALSLRGINRQAAPQGSQVALIPIERPKSTGHGLFRVKSAPTPYLLHDPPLRP